MNAPQIIMIVLLSIEVLGTALMHDKPKKPAMHNIYATLVGTALLVALLTWGGFF